MKELFLQLLIPFWWGTIGLGLGFIGSIGLVVLNKSPIRINESGTMSWGTPPDMTNEEWQRNNRKYLWQRRIGIPFSFGALAVGFVFQFIALWVSAI